MIITSLKNLFNKFTVDIKKINNLKYHKNILASYQGNDWKNYVFENKDTYNRKIVYINKEIELLIITWMPSQKTIIHDHPKNGCLFKILEGEIEEELFDNSNRKISKIFKVNDISYIDNNIGKHRINCNSGERCVTLHVYSPPYKKDLIDII